MLTVHRDAAGFLRSAQADLERHEAANNLMLGIALRLAEGGAYGDSPPYLATVRDEAGLAVAALMTPPHNLVVHSEREACGPVPELVLRDLLRRGYSIPGVLGRAPVARAFAEAWPAVSGRGGRPGMHQRVYELRQVVHPAYSPGHLRLACAADLNLLAAWIDTFHDEVFAGRQTVRAYEVAERMLQRQDLYLWDDGRPVSMANRTRPTRHGITVGLVYTPPELRGRGYATSCVAALSQRLLDEGRQFCTLFADLANPTSNAIYQRIGYRPICDFDEYVFS